MRKYYVYVFLREDRYTPYYVGKGCGKRCYNRKGRVIPPPQDPSRIVILREGLTEEESLELEKLLILFWGRIDNGTGVLRNLTDGGEGCVGIIRPQGEDSPFYGKENSHGLGYVITDPEGKTHIVSGLLLFSRENNLSSVSLHRVAKGIINTHKGYKVSYLDEERRKEADQLREDRRRHTSEVRRRVCSESNRRRKGEKRKRKGLTSK